jgi:hypothetical protein
MVLRPYGGVRFFGATGTGIREWGTCEVQLLLLLTLLEIKAS